MTMILASLIVMLVFVGMMSIGVMFGRKPLKGSCGGIGAALGEKDYVCELCGDDESKCEEINAPKTEEKSVLAYEVTQKNKK